MEAVKDDAWLKGDFIKTNQERGDDVIKARKLSSAMSAARAICDHMKDWWYGTKPVSISEYFPKHFAMVSQLSFLLLSINAFLGWLDHY